MSQTHQDAPGTTRTREGSGVDGGGELQPTWPSLAPNGQVDDQVDLVPAATGTETAQPADHGGEEPASISPPTLDGRRALLVTTALCVVFGAGGHLVLLAGWAGRTPGQAANLPWQPVVGASLTAVAILSFGGFYLASLRARVAIMSSFLLTFLLLLTYVLTVREVQPAGDAPLVRALIDDFRIIVQTIIGFYFGTETVLSLTKILRAPKGHGASIRRADRDLPAG